MSNRAAGTVNADILLQIDGRLESGASLVAQRVLRTSGGRAANVAVMSRRLGTPARLFGCAGRGALAQLALAGPRAAGVELADVRRARAEPGVATIVVERGATKTMVLAPGANDAFAESDGERLGAAMRSAPDGSVLVVDTELEEPTLVPGLEAARPRGAAAIVDRRAPAVRRIGS